MKLFRYAMAFALICIALAFNPAAQVAVGGTRHPLHAAVEAQLRSPEPKEVAWGAFIVGEERLAEAIPTLIECLDRPELERTDLGWDAARRAVLDALIRVHADPSLQVLERLYPLAKNEVLVLLSKPQVGRDQLLKRLLPTESGAAWLAIAGWMLEQRTAGFAAALLRDVPLTIEITVTHGDDDGYAGSELIESIGDGVLYPARGFPPIACYELWTQAVRGGIVLAEGPHPVYYTRDIGPPNAIPSCGSESSDAPTTQHRLDLLSELAASLGTGLQDVYRSRVQWTNAARLRSEASKLRRAVSAAYAEAVESLLHAKLITPEESRTLQPGVQIELRDRRRDRRVALPDVNKEDGGRHR